MKNNIISIFILFVVTLLSCNEKKGCDIKVIDIQIIEKTAMYSIYSSDTCWNDMIVFTDSLIQKARLDSNYNIAVFMYPEKSIPKFKPNSFAVEGGDFNNLYKVMEVHKFSQEESPFKIIKYPERYIEAKQAEKTNNN